MTAHNRKETCKIGEALGTLTQEDIQYIMDPDNDENAVQRRLITARQRKMKAERGYL